MKQLFVPGLFSYRLAQLCNLHCARPDIILMIMFSKYTYIVFQLAEENTHGYHPNPTNHLPLKICNKEVVFIDSFTYLESLITNDGSSSRAITSRISHTYRYYMVSKILHYIVHHCGGRYM